MRRAATFLWVDRSVQRCPTLNDPIVTAGGRGKNADIGEGTNHPNLRLLSVNALEIAQAFLLDLGAYLGVGRFRFTRNHNSDSLAVSIQ